MKKSISQSFLCRVLGLLIVAFSTVQYSEAKEVAANCQIPLGAQNFESTEVAFATSIARLAEMMLPTPENASKILCIKLAPSGEYIYTGSAIFNIRIRDQVSAFWISVHLTKEAEWMHIVIDIERSPNHKNNPTAPCISSSEIATQLKMPWKSEVRIDPIHSTIWPELAWSSHTGRRTITPDIVSMKTSCASKISILYSPNEGK